VILESLEEHEQELTVFPVFKEVVSVLDVSDE
jgi:hypothetical protein